MLIKEYLPFYKKNLKLAIPVMLTQAGQITVNIVDNIMVGHLGTAELAAVSLSNSIFILGFVFGIGFTQGLTPLIGQAYGSKDYKRVGLLLQNSFTLNTLLVIILTIAMFSIGNLMNNMGQVPEVVSLATGYYNIQLFSVLPFIIFFGLRQFSEGIGITKYAMYITLSANFVNIILNWILIYGKLGFPAMGINGAAYATLISRIIMLLLFLYVILKKEEYNQFFNYFSGRFISTPIIKQILRTSIPLSLQNLIEITTFSISAIMVGWLGKVQLASHQIAMAMSSFSFMLALGIGAAATITVSHHFGSKNYSEMKKAGDAAVHLSVFIMLISAFLYITLHNFIPKVFTIDPLVVSLASTLLIISATFQIFDAIQLSSLANLRALADVKIPLVISISSYYFVCLPLGYILGFVFNLGAIGVWIGLLTGLALVAVFFMRRFDKIANDIILKNETNIKL